MLASLSPKERYVAKPMKNVFSLPFELEMDALYVCWFYVYERLFEHHASFMWEFKYIKDLQSSQEILLQFIQVNDLRTHSQDILS